MKALCWRRNLVLFAFVVLFSPAANAQSGRRGKEKSPAPPAASVPDPKSNETNAQKPARLQLLVGIDDPSGFDRVPLRAAEIALDACLRRLAEARDVVAMGAPRRMSRGEAVKAAKEETTRYVVWLRVGNERAEYGADVSAGSEDFYVEFTIFEPGTAKTKRSGRAQHGDAKIGNVGVSRPSTRGALYSEYVIRESARAAADRILAAFEIRLEGPWPR